MFGRNNNEFEQKFTMLINNVLNIDMSDLEKVGRYDVNTIDYEK